MIIKKRRNWRRIKWLVILAMAAAYIVVVGSWWIEGSKNGL